SPVLHRLDAEALVGPVEAPPFRRVIDTVFVDNARLGIERDGLPGDNALLRFVADLDLHRRRLLGYGALLRLVLDLDIDHGYPRKAQGLVRDVTFSGSTTGAGGGTSTITSGPPPGVAR